MAYAWFWKLLVLLVVASIAASELAARRPWYSRRPWYLRANCTEVLIATPWGVLWIADGAYDPTRHARFSGVQILRRILGTQNARLPSLIFEEWYVYTAKLEAIT